MLLRLKTKLLHRTPVLPPSPSMQTNYSYSQVNSTKPIPQLTKKGFLLRVAISFALEAGFVLLCALCLLKPLPLNLPISLSNAKAFFTVISILWQLLLTLPLGDITNHCFSSEWYFQVTRRNNFMAGRPDVVSVLTAGMLDQLKHAVTPRSSNRFRVAFVVMLMNIGIRAIFPGSLSPANALHQEPTKVLVARATNVGTSQGSTDSTTTWFYLWLSRAGLIGQLEQQNVITFGLETQKGWMVGWPSTLAKGLEGSLRYPTDTVHFDFQCNWESQDFLKQEDGHVIAYPQLGRRDVANFTMAGTALLPVDISANDSDYRVAFLFSGQNSQTPSTDARSFLVNLDGLPTFNATGMHFEASGEPLYLDAPVAALLVCDPHLGYSGGEAQLYPNGSISVTRSGDPPIGNIDNSTFLGSIFQGSVSGFFSPDPETTDTFTLPAIQAFLPFSVVTPGNFDDTHVVSPLPLEEISSNLNGVATSIAKSFSSGAIIGESFGIPVSSMLLEVDGWVEKEKLILTTNPRFFWIGTGLWSVTTCLLVYLGWFVDWETLKPFALDSVLDSLKDEKLRQEADG